MSTFDARRRITQVGLNQAGSGLEILSKPDVRSVFLVTSKPGFPKLGALFVFY